MSIVVDNLVKTYGKQNAVDHVSFQVQPGEILGFLGPNGAGKSTTMKIATCYLPPSAGKVVVGGQDVTKASMPVRRMIGYLPENNPLYLDMYVHEYLRFVGRLYGLKGKKLRIRVEELIELTGLDNAEQNKKIGALSKGFRQRVGLAQAMIHDPDILILDEPTTGLDPNQILEIRSLIQQIGQEKTVLFSTHIMQEVQALCDRVVIIHNGQIVADSPVAELRTGGASLQTFIIEFDGKADIRPFKAIEGVLDVVLVEEGIYRVQADREHDIRSKLFKAAADHDLTLVRIEKEESSMEAIFHRLTQGE